MHVCNALPPSGLHEKTLSALNKKHYGSISNPENRHFNVFTQKESFAGIFYGYGQATEGTPSPFATIAHLPRISKNSQNFSPGPKPLHRISVSFHTCNYTINFFKNRFFYNKYIWLQKAGELLNITSYQTRIIMEAINLEKHHARFVSTFWNLYSYMNKFDTTGNCSNEDNVSIQKAR